MSCKIEYKGKQYTEQEIAEMLSLDKNLVAKYRVKDIDSNPFLDGNEESISVFGKKVEHMQSMMDVEVVVDGDVETSRVLAASDPRTLAAGKPVILINPSAVFDTTVIHEFGHIFIDSIPGGMTNPRVIEALNSLKKSKLRAEVVAAYPELTGEKLDKEILATALGLKGAEIWDNAQDAGAWDAFMKWFSDLISRTFKINDYAVTELAKQLLDPLVKKEISQEMSDYAQLQKTGQKSSNDHQDILDKVANKEDVLSNSLEKLYGEIGSRIVNLEKWIEGSTNKKAEKQAEKKGVITSFMRVKMLNKEFNDLKDVSELQGISAYVGWSEDQIRVLQQRITKARADVTQYGDKLEIEDGILKQMREYVDAFNVIDDIINYIKAADVVGPNQRGFTEKHRQRFLARVEGLQDKAKSFSKDILTIQRNKFAKMLSENDIRAFTLAKNELGRKFDEIHPEGTESDRSKYIEEQFIIIKPQVIADSYEKNLALSVASPTDVSGTEALFVSEKQVNSRAIQLVSRNIEVVELAISEFYADEASKMDAANKLFSESGFDSMEKKYKGMYDKAESGQYYFASKYKADFYEEMRAAHDMAQDPEKYAIYNDVEIKENGNEYAYTYEGKTRALSLYGATVTKVDSSFVSYVNKGSKEIITIPVAEAVAKSELVAWTTENVENPSDGVKFPKGDKWINKEFANLSPKKAAELEMFKETLDRNAKMTKGSSLRRQYGDAEFYLLPGNRKSSMERMKSLDGKGYLKDSFEGMYKVQEDEFDIEGNRTGKTLSVSANAANQERSRVRMPYRNKIMDPNNQSLDLHSMVLLDSAMSKNFELKDSIEAHALIILDVLKGRKTEATQNLTGRRKVHAANPDLALYNDDGTANKDAEMLESIIGNRIHDIKSIDAGAIGGVADINKVTASLLKYSGMTSLIGNWANSIVNYNVGSISNFFEAVGGEQFNLRDLAKGKKTYWQDIKGIMTDVFGETNVDHSRTNLLVNIFNVVGDKSHLKHNFSTGNLGQTIDMGSLRPVAKMGEHMVQAQLMYAVMHSIKITNNKGEYLNAQGEVVATKKEAADMNDVITFQKKNGGIVLSVPEFVGGNSFTGIGTREEMLLDLRNLVKKKIEDGHGRYDPDIQAAFQRMFWGKAFAFLRKWIEPGLYRRYRGISSLNKNHAELTDADRFFSDDLKMYQEGYYVTAIRFIKQLGQAVKSGSLQEVKDFNKNLLPHEKANKKRAIAELIVVLGLFLAHGLLDDEDDMEKNLIAKYLINRQHAEMTFFVNPGEAMKIAESPTAGMGTVKAFIRLAGQMANPTERYEKGVHKGELKVYERLRKFRPRWRTFEDIKESEKFLNK